MRTLNLYEGYQRLDELTADYEKVVNERNNRLDEERAEQEKLNAERNFDKESKKASKKLRK